MIMHKAVVLLACSMLLSLCVPSAAAANVPQNDAAVFPPVSPTAVAIDIVEGSASGDVALTLENVVTPKSGEERQSAATPPDIVETVEIVDDDTPYGGLAQVDLSASLSASVINPYQGTMRAPAIGMAVTAEQLTDMLFQWPDSTPFFGDDVKVWIPSDTLRSLELSGEDTFALRARYEEGKSIQILAEVNGETAELAVASIVVGIPWDGADAACTNAAGAAIESTYAPDRGLLLLNASLLETVFLNVQSQDGAANSAQGAAAPALAYKGLERAQTSDITLYAVLCGILLLALAALPPFLFLRRKRRNARL